ncbi:MAG: quinohemoprotein ethanol dehydrogenase [Solirubrobacterales bacterium]|jgi:alcohol dehydrogenase (cytochrome c)|nr:quinohemoprotein ethanol dehydrogenase [Solirubrobacterales bacterium]
MNTEDKFSATVWIAIALGAIGMGVAVAFVAGFFLGHFTGHTKTTTVTAGAPAQSESAEASESVVEITPAPAFTADELAAEPTTNWLTNGGDLSNQRYSPLEEITVDNVAGLKGKWHIHLNNSAVATKYSAEGTPITYEGVMYIPTGADDVFAIDIKTGKKLWVYEAKLPEQIDTICCGWDNRGVAIGDGLIYVARLDGKVVALDQQTGETKWTAEVGKWQDGETITSAPLYYNGRVYAGVSGGEFGIRGHLTAFDAKTGKLDWKFWTVPGPGEVGHDSWPKGSDSWKHGGAPIWNTPAVDPELNMLYFSTGNASPDLNGSGRPGENLFTTAIVAIDATTGKYKWHFQEVHHDIWDYDAPSPVVLWNANVNGEEVKGLSQPGKTGWLYMLNRETGKPVHGIEEKGVPQNKAEQATWATQPFPTTEPFVPHSITQPQFKEIQKLANQTFKGKAKIKVRKGQMFDQFGKEMTVMATGPSGGTNWPPSSYNPNTEDVYICGIGGYAGYQTDELEKLHLGKTYLSSVLSLNGFGSYDGYLVAQNVGTGEIDWTVKLPKEACYSGTTTTAGNIVFSGRSNGELVAYNAETGDKLWSFQTGAGANTTPAVFEMEGTEYVAFYSGGNSLAASSHGDDMWLFSLDGEIEPVAAGGEAEQGQHAGEETPEANVDESEGSPAEAKENKAKEAQAATGDPTAGKMVFSENCSICHGFDGEGGNGGPDLTTQPLAQTVNGATKQVTNGGGGMPAFKELLSTSEIEDVAAYVAEVINGKGK